MAKIIGVHGINQEFLGSHMIREAWLPAVKGGLERAGACLESDSDFQCAFYGDVFRGPKQSRGSIPNYDAHDIEEGIEQELLLTWSEELSRLEPDSQNPHQSLAPKGKILKRVQQALNKLSEQKYFSGVAEKVVIRFFKQVGAYLEDDSIRNYILQQVANSIESDTTILIGHSLGSVACYESLCEHPEWPVKTLITIGSPLGMQTLIFDRLRPSPQKGLGHWPGSLKTWVNIADVDDVVALRKELNPLFNGEINDQLVNNGIFFHSAKRYLTAVETGAAIKLGLED